MFDPATILTLSRVVKPPWTWRALLLDKHLLWITLERRRSAAGSSFGRGLVTYRRSLYVAAPESGSQPRIVDDECTLQSPVPKSRDSPPSLKLGNSRVPALHLQDIESSLSTMADPSMAMQDQDPSFTPPQAGAVRSLRVLACVLCQQRKIKCDRNMPCANCTKVPMPRPFSP